ncbi:uncharacterized protein LOC124451256 [Xenia sp. Carnegie-2017]|uniref:uncharacterized protein LOC124451256 n=1 Tax=Xenia sp. Carnegie-2017 TaxID=2897299 RepID=UPI001F04D4BB|nr:uncharacterized protein LOC124451256 [Xenia sp. Carnegie-2017]
MISHSFLHAGSPLFGISKVVVDYLVCDKDEILLIEVVDIPDIHLRIALNELNSLGKDEAPGTALKDVLTQYRAEASILDTSFSVANRHVIAQQIMLHVVITCRKSKLQDLADGMNEFGLIDFLKKHKDVVQPQLFHNKLLLLFIKAP